MRRDRLFLTAPFALALLVSACASQTPDQARRDIGTLLELSHAQDRFDATLRDFIGNQAERNPELKPYVADIEGFWREQMPWSTLREQVIADYAGHYRPEDIRAILNVLGQPQGAIVVSHNETLNRELAARMLAVMQEKTPALEQHLRDVRNAREIGATDVLTPEEDFAAIKERAETGDAASQLLLAEKYLSGEGTERDLTRALQWLERSAAQDHAPAQDTLAAFYYRGVVVARDYRKARDLMEKAAAHNYVPAVNNLAWMLATCPDDAMRDGKRALALLGPLADQGAQMLDTLAAAHAETGNMTQALALQKRAIMALGNTGDANFPGFLDRLQSYAAGRPWRDPLDAR